MVKQVNVRNKQPGAQAIDPFELGRTNLAVLLLILQIIFLVVCLQLTLLKDFTDIAPYGKIKTLSFYDGVFPFRKVKLMMFFLWEKLNMPSVITGENIYRKSFVTFLVKVILKMNLLNLIRLTKMVKQNEIVAPYLIFLIYVIRVGFI